MRHIRIWENFSNENSFPLSITVKPTQKYENHLAEIKNLDGRPTFLVGQEFTLWNDNDPNKENRRYNLVQVATTPFESRTTTKYAGKLFEGKEDQYWLSYHPEIREIQTHTLRVFGFSTPLKGEKMITNQDARWAKADWYREEGLLWIFDSYGKFDKGFEVGMVDSRGYFEIIDTKFE